MIEERRVKLMSEKERYKEARRNAIFTTNYSCGIEGNKVSAAVWNDPRYQKALKSNTKFFYDLLTDLEANA